MIRKSIATLAVGAALLLGSASAAAARPAPDLPAITAVAQSYLASKGLPVPLPSRLVVVDQVETGGRDYDTDTISLSTASAKSLLGLANPRSVWVNGLGAETLLHELLHYYSKDEGLVDAVAVDLTPGFAVRLAGQQGRGVGWSGNYPAQAAVWRRASIAAVGQSWKSKAATLWRMAQLAAGERPGQ